MFTLKVYSAANPGASVPCYRHIAVREYEVSAPRPDQRGWATLTLTNFDGTVWEWQLRPGEYVFVENAAGKTIEHLRELGHITAGQGLSAASPTANSELFADLRRAEARQEPPSIVDVTRGGNYPR